MEVIIEQIRHPEHILPYLNITQKDYVKESAENNGY